MRNEARTNKKKKNNAKRDWGSGNFIVVCRGERGETVKGGLAKAAFGGVRQGRK